MADSTLILNLAYRLELTSEEYRVLKGVAEIFYDVPGEKQMINAVAFILREYGIRGCRIIVAKIKADETITDRVENLDLLVFHEEET